MIKISEVATKKLVSVLIEDLKPYIRFGLKGAGCHGFQYYFMVEEIKEEDDFTIPLGDTEYVMLIDAASMMYLQDMDIDYREDLMQDGFVFLNPDVSSTCGCGQSVTFD